MDNPPDPRTARAILADWAHARRGRIAELAREHGTHASTVSRWLTGETIPSQPSRLLLEQRVGIPRRLWEVPS
jgi:transcriptional regulator with XRE-family HTH domain